MRGWVRKMFFKDRSTDERDREAEAEEALQRVKNLELRIGVTASSRKLEEQARLGRYENR